MATLIQTGFLGSVGPVFVLAGYTTGRVVVIQGEFNKGVLLFRAKQPAYANNLRSFYNNSGPSRFDYTANDCSLADYQDNQLLEFPELEKYRVPRFAADDIMSFEFYQRVDTDYVEKDVVRPVIPTNPTPTNPTPTNPTPSNPTPTNPTPSNPTPSNPTPSNPTSNQPTNTGAVTGTTTGTNTSPTYNAVTNQKALNSIMFVVLGLFGLLILNINSKDK